MQLRSLEEKKKKKMSKKEKIELLVDAGKAVSNQEIGQKLGPLKINIPDLLNKINEKTAIFKGMKVPVKLFIDVKTKDIEIQVGTPPVSELIKKELSLEKGSGIPNKEKIANISIEQVIKIAKMKQDSMFVNDLKAAVKNVIGSCNSMGVLIESIPAKDFIKKIDSYNDLIKQQKTEVSKEKLNKLKEDLEEHKRIYKKEQEKLKALQEAEAPKVEKAEEKAEKVDKKEEKETEVKKEVVKEEKKK
jgi:large subunit ribosomal protein L11